MVSPDGQSWPFARRSTERTLTSVYTNWFDIIAVVRGHKNCDFYKDKGINVYAVPKDHRLLPTRSHDLYMLMA